ncbi:MAG TPA: pilus assembly protein PilM [Gammaproteobacteria bacterium]|nr:pilus assembly protein PilM [Gammaproteobacteria bacterium]
MALFRKSNPPLLGIDISSTAVKVLELRRQDSRYRVESYAVEPLPPNAVVEKVIVEADAVAAATRNAVKRSRSKAKLAAVAVPTSMAISKTIPLAAGLDDREMAAQIESQANQYVPYPLEELNLDFQVLGPSEDSQGDVDVLLVASRSENVDARVAVLEAAELTPRIVDVESYAMENAFSLIAQQLPGDGRNQVIAIADVGATMTTLTVVDKGQIIYTREQAFGGKQLTEEIMRRYGLSYEEAGRAKRQGGLPDTYPAEILEPFREDMVQQISRALQFFFSASQHSQIDHLLLAGGCAALPNATAAIQEATGTKTTIANPFSSMAVASSIRPQLLAEDAPALMIACGLAMRSFD